jgi:phosphohistidine phosphatase SixA
MRYQSLSLILFLIFTASVAQGQEVVYLIRHAEQERFLENPPLTYAGHQRAKAWARILEKTGIKVVYTSNQQRALQTGEHIAEALGIPLKSVPRKDVTSLVNQIRTQHANDAVLIVTHKLQMPKIFKELGFSADVSEKFTFNRDEYDNLFIVVPEGKREGTVSQLQYK